MTSELLFEFYGELPQLSRTCFKRENGEVIVSVRGKTAGAIQGAGTFQWTSAVIALCSLLLRTKLANLRTDPLPSFLSGEAGSLAATLDYALSKQPTWTIDMFGLCCSSHTYLRRLILRSNAERKFPGPVTLSVNTKLLNTESLKVWWNGRLMQEQGALSRLLSLIEDNWNNNLQRGRILDMHTHVITAKVEVKELSLVA